jgi:ankyrin repeat protein
MMIQLRRCIQRYAKIKVSYYLYFSSKMKKNEIQLPQFVKLQGRYCNATMFIVDKFNNTSLHVACMNNIVGTILFITDNHPKLINMQNSQGITPIMWAIVNKNLPIVKLLYKKGANINLKVINGDDCNDWARRSLDENMIKYIRSISK